MMRLDAVATLFPDLGTVELEAWVARRWVQPEPDLDAVWIFAEIDVARVRLIYDLQRQLDTPEDTITLVLSLLDQLYELRGALKSVTRAVAAQPEGVQQAIRAAVVEDRDAA
jgi:chaperone modulatory protein CbpM